MSLMCCGGACYDDLKQALRCLIFGRYGVEGSNGRLLP